MGSTKVTPRLVELGALLRRLRGRAGLSQTLMGQSLGRSHTHVSRWETGNLSIEETELERFLSLCSATSEETAEALRLHRDASDPNWLIPGASKDLAVVTEYESAADSVTAVQPSLIPGPLQTFDYATEVIAGGGANESQISDWVKLRMARRDSLLGGCTRFEAFIGEHAVRYPACSRKVGIAQLADLQAAAILPHVSVSIVPFRLGYDPTREGGFVLIRSTGSRTVVHLEEFRSSTTLTNVKDVRDYETAAEQVRRGAMTPVASLEFIAQIQSELEHAA